MKTTYINGERITVRIEHLNEEGFDLVLESQKKVERFRVRYEEFPFLRMVSDVQKFIVFPSGIWWDQVGEGIEFDSLRFPERYPLHGPSHTYRRTQKGGRP